MSKITNRSQQSRAERLTLLRAQVGSEISEKCFYNQQLEAGKITLKLREHQSIIKVCEPCCDNCAIKN